MVLYYWKHPERFTVKTFGTFSVEDLPRHVFIDEKCGSLKQSS